MSAVQHQKNPISNATHIGDAANQYLTFILADEEYGVEILRVQEIMGREDATPIPNAPEHILGVINIRGEIVPIVDLRKRFDLESIAYGPTTVVIVVNMVSSDQQRTVGLVVDAVSEVYRIDPEQIQTTPEMGTNLSTKWIKGLITVEEKMLLLLEVDRLVDFSDLEPVNTTEAA